MNEQHGGLLQNDAEKTFIIAVNTKKTAQKMIAWLV